MYTSIIDVYIFLYIYIYNDYMSYESSYLRDNRPANIQAYNHGGSYSHIAFAAHLRHSDSFRTRADGSARPDDGSLGQAWANISQALSCDPIHETWPRSYLSSLVASASPTLCSVRWLRKRTHEEADPWLRSLWICVGFASSRCSSVLEGFFNSELCWCIADVYSWLVHKEVAHLQKHAAFWSLHIKPVARLIVMATDSEVGEVEVLMFVYFYLYLNLYVILYIYLWLYLVNLRAVAKEIRRPSRRFDAADSWTARTWVGSTRSCWSWRARIGMPQLPKTSAMNKLLGQVSGTFECYLEHPESTGNKNDPIERCFQPLLYCVKNWKTMENEKVQNRA
jgi:hypothetical protein